MNVERSTFVRRGYLLTALAVAVLLAGSSGTAWAQSDYSIKVSSSSTLQEGASDRPQHTGAPYGDHNDGRRSPGTTLMTR